MIKGGEENIKIQTKGTSFKLITWVLIKFEEIVSGIDWE